MAEPELEVHAGLLGQTADAGQLAADELARRDR